MNRKRNLLAFALLSFSFSLFPVPCAAQSDADLQAADAPANAVWLETLDISQMTTGWNSPGAGKSADNHPLTLNGAIYPHGVGTHAVSDFLIDLKGVAVKFVATVGVDDEVKGGSVTFTVFVDGKKSAASGLMRSGDAPKRLEVDLTGAKKIRLLVEDGGDGISYDHADWAGAMLVLTPGATVKPTAYSVPVAPPRMTVPPVAPKPTIHGAKITGTTPGRPFLFLIAATGERPMKFSAKNLPAGLALDPDTGIISGSLKADGQTVVELTAKNSKGTAKRGLTIVGGTRKLALTPPMGWNSWNIWADHVDAEKVKISADAMVSSGLSQHGFQYINIDDCWESPMRDADGNIQTNAKFPDMKALTDYVHAKGLRMGIYSSPGPKTCGGYEASWQHEQQDADSYARWGFDYLKYDWCSYGNIAPNPDLDAMKKPYIVMSNALDHTTRDILFSLCQYGMGDVWKWGGEAPVNGNCYRTTGDITDNWGSLHGIYTAQNGHEKYAGPGHWSDPDMLIVGRVGWGNPHPSRLTPNEQIVHISMWCLLSSPLLIGCDMGKLDPFTLALLSNDEALDINQDVLGKPAGRVAKTGEAEVWARPLADGAMAVGLINGEAEAQTMTVNWSDLKIKGGKPVRDLWLHKNVGSFSDKYSVEVPAHGAVLLKIGRPSGK